MVDHGLPGLLLIVWCSVSLSGDRLGATHQLMIEITMNHFDIFTLAMRCSVRGLRVQILINGALLALDDVSFDIECGGNSGFVVESGAAPLTAWLFWVCWTRLRIAAGDLL
jgi:hypothetical protein